MDMPTIDLRVKRLNTAHNLSNKSIAEVSKLTGVNRGTLSSYLSGKYLPKQDRLYLLSKVYNVNVGWLMGLDVSMEDDSSITDPPSLRFAMLVGDRAKKLRVDKNLSIEFLAKELGTDVKTISNLEAGVDHGFDVELFYKYSVYFDVPPAYFIIEEFNEEVNIGKNIKILMEINDISVDTISKKYNHPRKFLSNLENEPIKYSMIEEACSFFNIQPIFLICHNFEKENDDPKFAIEMRMKFIAKNWVDKVGTTRFNDAELKRLLSYAKFIISERE